MSRRAEGSRRDVNVTCRLSEYSCISGGALQFSQSWDEESVRSTRKTKQLIGM